MCIFLQKWTLKTWLNAYSFNIVLSSLSISLLELMTSSSFQVNASCARQIKGQKPLVTHNENKFPRRAEQRSERKPLQHVNTKSDKIHTWHSWRRCDNDQLGRSDPICVKQNFSFNVSSPYFASFSYRARIRPRLTKWWWQTKLYLGGFERGCRSQLN